MRGMDIDQPDQSDLDTQKIAANVRAEMARAGLTIMDLARLMDQKHAWLQRRTSGHVPFRVQELIQIGRLLGIYPATFFNGITVEPTIAAGRD